MKGLKTLSLLLLALTFMYSESKAQTQEITGGNLLNGAITGSLLGAATMGLANSNDFVPLRVGLGGGILGGAGLVAYDMATRPSGGDLFVSGYFNDGSNTSIIILLDTVYGAAGGALIGMGSMLIADKPLTEGLQYGASAGAWTGFTFGLIDAFFLAERQRDMMGSLLQQNSVVDLKGTHYRVGILQPSAFKLHKISQRDVTKQIEPALGVLSIRLIL